MTVISKIWAKDVLDVAKIFGKNRTNIKKLWGVSLKTADEGPEGDQYTSILLHMDDVGLTDSSQYNHTPTIAGAVRTATQSKFGGYSAFFVKPSLYPDPGDTIIYPANAAFDFGWNGSEHPDFTVEAWVYIDGTITGGTSYGIVGNRHVSLKEGWVLKLSSSANREIFFEYYESGNPYPGRQFSAGTAVGLNAWHHIAIVRDGNTLRAFYDGNPTSDPTYSMPSASMRGSSGVNLYVGREVQHNFGWFDGWIDEVRVSNGIARWTTSFTPTGPYS